MTLSVPTPPAGTEPEMFHCDHCGRDISRGTHVLPDNSNEVLCERCGTPPTTKTFYVATWKTEYRKAYIDAESQQQARTIAEQSLAGTRDDVEWSVFDEDGGRVECVEEL